MTGGVVLGALPVVISSTALAVAIISMRRQWRSARNANAVAAILKLFEEYRTEELRSARRPTSMPWCCNLAGLAERAAG
ncbi:hypothetical protein ACQP2Y_06560 [Actinoplanes sp. CA-051413]|uniref:hypothetical protein n=1 Tax=Actinoplanes sp. CA-051413 TaxID=3239899 RepID=UPI003D9727E4